MKSNTELTGPAKIATLLFLIFSIFSAPAMADDRLNSDANEASSEQIEETSKEQARQANEAAVEDAAQAVEANIRLDLDIRLIGRTSMLIAGEVQNKRPE